MRRLVTCGVLALSLAALAALAACAGGGDPDPAPAPSGTATDAAVDTAEVVATSTLHLGGTDITVDVLPVVRVDELAVLTLDLAMPDGDGDGVFLASDLSGVPVLKLPALAGLRLLDLGADAVHTVAVDASDRAVTTGTDFITLRPGESMRLQTAYAAPAQEVDALALFLPGGPLVEDVPVVEGAVPPPSHPGDADDADGPVEPLDLDAVAEAPVVPLESYTAELAGAVQTLTSTEEVQVTLGSDVLFAVDSAELGDAARGALDVAAAHLSSREPGTVQVVGHTDDVAGDAYNQELSERRARAVADALSQRIDTTRFPVEASGRGESEPVVPNVDDASRAANRRVTLVLTSQITQTVEVSTAGELPPFEAGPTGTGAEGVVVENLGSYRVTVPAARRVDGHVVLDLEVTPLDDRATSGVSFLSGVWHYRGSTYSVQRSASGVVLLRGATAVHPLDHLDAVADDGTEQWLPVTDLETLGTIAEGATRTFSIVYPEVGDVDEIAVQVGGGLGQQAFRLTDIPVR